MYILYNYLDYDCNSVTSCSSEVVWRTKWQGLSQSEKSLKLSEFAKHARYTNFFERPVTSQLVKLLRFMELDDLLLCYKSHLTCPCAEPVAFSPHPPNLFKIYFNIILPPLTCVLRVVCFPTYVSTESAYTFIFSLIHATCFI